MCYGIIYTVENKINGKIYVGQTTKIFDERYRGDILNTHNEHLRNSIKKYGIENFVIDKCICECDSEEELNEAEKFYIDFFDAMNREHGYNKKGGGSNGLLSEETKEKISESLKGEKHPMYNKHHSQETKQKMSKALKGKRHSEETKEKISDSLKGKHHSEEMKQKMSKAKKGEKNSMYGKRHSEETKKKMSEAKKRKYCGEKHPKARAIIQLDKKGNLIRKWSFIKEAAKELNISSISACCRGRIKSAGGYVWMYEEDYIDLIKCGF